MCACVWLVLSVVVVVSVCVYMGTCMHAWCMHACMHVWVCVVSVAVPRCFTFGIGSGASTALVEGLARAGNGSAEFVKEGERLQPKVSPSIKLKLSGFEWTIGQLFYTFFISSRVIHRYTSTCSSND